MDTNAQNRNERLDYQGLVRLFIPFEPWQLMFSLKAENISASGILATYVNKTDKDQEAECLFIEGDSYDMQLDHNFDHLPSPLLNAELSRISKTRNGLSLGFKFANANADLLSMLHELN